MRQPQGSVPAHMARSTPLGGSQGSLQLLIGVPDRPAQPVSPPSNFAQGRRPGSPHAPPADRADRPGRPTDLQGDWRPEHLFTLGHARATYAHYQQLIAECDQEIEASIRSFSPLDEPPNETEDAAEPAADVTPPSDESDAEPFNMQEHLSSLFGTDLTLIPGIGVSTALVLFTKLGLDLARFPTAAQFSSWLNLCPHNKITGGKIISSHTGPGGGATVPRVHRHGISAGGKIDPS